MHTDELLQAAAVIGVSVLSLIFLMLCVFVLGASIMLFERSVEWLEDKLGW